MTPQEQQALYEANVLKIAEEMTREYRTHIWKPPNAVPDWEQIGLERDIRIFLPTARIALKHMAQEVRHNLFFCSDLSELQIEDQLFSRGLVPAKEG